ncbi:hypothetical protein Tco_1013454 [Tanacetum coccineum]
MVLLVVILSAGRLVSAGRTLVLLVVILSAGRLVSAGRTMILLVVILSAERLVSAGRTMILLVVILSAERLVSAGRTMILLFDIAGWLVSATSHLVSAGCTMVLLVVILPAGRMVSAGCTMILLVVILPAGCLVSAGSIQFIAASCTLFLLTVILPAGRLVSAGCTMVLLVVIFPAGRLVSAGCTMVLLVVIFPAGRLVSAGCTMVLLVVIFPAGRLVSAGCTMVLLVVIVPAGFFGVCSCCLHGFCCWMTLAATTQPADDHDSAGGSSFHPAGSATPMSGSAVPDTAGGPLDTTDSDDSSSPSPVSTDHIPIDVLFEPTPGGINAFFLDSDEDEQIGLSRVAAEPDSADDQFLRDSLSAGCMFLVLVLWLWTNSLMIEIVRSRVKLNPFLICLFFLIVSYVKQRYWRAKVIPLCGLEQMDLTFLFLREIDRIKISFHIMKSLLPHVYREDLLLLCRRMNRWKLNSPGSDENKTEILCFDVQYCSLLRHVLAVAPKTGSVLRWWLLPHFDYDVHRVHVACLSAYAMHRARSKGV